MPTRIYVEVGVDMRNLSAARRLGVGERRERRDEDGRRGGGRAVRAVALVVVVARVVVAAAGRVVVVELRAELRAAAGARRRERARVRRVAPWRASPSRRFNRLKTLGFDQDSRRPREDDKFPPAVARRRPDASALTNFTLHCTGLNILVGERTPRKAWSPTSVG